MTSIGNLGHRGKVDWAPFTFVTRNGHMTAEKIGKGKDSSITEALVLLVGILTGQRQQDQQRISEEQ